MKKNIIVLLFVGLYTIAGYSQESPPKLDDTGRIALIPIFNHPIENMPNAASSLIINKLNQIVVNNGISGNSLGGKFIITANINILTKDITPTAPPMHAYTLEVTFYIGDGVEGNLFSQTSLSVKGVGETEAKAYISALKTINSKDVRFKELTEIGKKKIIQYYEAQCDFFITEAKNLENQNKFDLALTRLSSVPEVCANCYEKVSILIPSLYQKKIDFECNILLSEAQNAWAASPNIEGAKNTANYLSRIAPNSTCFQQAQILTNSIAKRILEVDKREWDFVLREQNIEADLNQAAILAARAIGVAQAQNQPTTIVYNNFSHWFY